jgi:hypothetical protein
MNQTTREQIRRLQGVIRNANGAMVGVVATATTGGPGYERYGYAYYGSDNGRLPSRRLGWLRRRKPTKTEPVSESELATRPAEFSDV